MRNNKNYKENSNYNSKKEKQQSKIKKILLIFVFILLIIALQFGISKYISTTDQTHLLYFYEYRIQLSEIVLSTENYTGGEVTVEITTQKPGLSIQYQLGDSEEWIDYVGPFSVDENVKINTRLVSEPDNFTGPITSKEIKNIAVAKIGDQYFKTLAAAIDACAENAGDNKTKIEMLANIEENVVIPEGKNIVLDLCGATIKNKATNENGTQNTNPTIAVNGKLNLIDSAKNEDETLQGEGKVTSTTAEAIKVLGNGNFVLGTNESGTGAENVISIINPVVEGNTYGVAVEGNAKFEFYDGKISGKINAINGIVAATPEYYEVVSNKENDYEVAILSQAATITFDKNADESVNITLEYETATKVIGQPIESLPTAQREGYVFVGWFTAKENGEQITVETIVEGTATYYAIWEAYTYTIEYNANGGSGTTQETNAKYDEEIIIPDNTFTAPEGYTFKEWNTNTEGTGTIYNPGDKVINLSNEQSAIIQLYAIWEDTISPSKTAPTGTGTTNTITVNCNQTDAGSGIDETTIQYAIFNKDTNADGIADAWSEWQNSNIFENLSTNTEYEVKTQVTDKNGNGPVESEIGKISTSKIENGSIEVRKENAQGEIIKPETSAENKENQVNSNIYVDITPSTTGTTTVTVKTPDGQTTTYTEDTTITTQTGMYEITVETTDGTNTVTDTYYVFVDKTAPTAQLTTSKTTNTITVNANAQDSDSGIADVTYTIKKGDEIVESNKTGEFAGLEDNIEYTVEITITDKAGNTITKIENVKTEELVPGSIAFTETTSGETITPANTSSEAIVWVNENINAVLTQGSTGTTTYEITAPDGTKTTYEQDAQIATTQGDYVVTLRTTDGTNTKTVEYYFSVDKTVPTVTINPNEKDYTLQVGESSLNLETTISVVENESGLAITKYAISTSNTEKPQDSEFKDFVAGSQITENLTGGEYYVWVMVQDNAGNIAKTELLDAIVSGEFNIGHTVEYNLNGGTGEFASFRKPHGQNVGLSAEKPVRERYIFKGWSELADTSEINYAVGGTYTKNESKVLYAVWGEVVASTTIGEEVTLYESVQEAIDAAGTNEGAVVTLLKDEIAENVTVAAGQNIILDVNGKTLKNATAGYTINNLGELTIIGEGTINGNSTSATIKSNTTGKTVIDGNCLINAVNHYPISNNNIFILNNGTIKSEAKEAIANYSTGTVEINGGSVQGVTYGVYNDGGNVIVSGGNVQGSTDGIENLGNITVSGGNIQGNTYGILNYKNVTITDGIIKGNYAINNTKNNNVLMTGGEMISEYSVYNNGNMEITGGKVFGKLYAIIIGDVAESVLTIGTNEENPSVDITSPVIIGDSYGINNPNNYTLNFYDGIIMGPTNQTIQGTVTDTPTGYRVVNGTQTIDGTTYETAYLDNTYYITFNENYENAPITTKDIKYGTAIGELPTPTRENYIFDGWYTAQTDGEKITKETIITADTTFYAHWLEVVASTTIGDVTTNYASVQNAINAAGTNAGATVTLLKDEIAENVKVAAGQNMVLDVNGKTLTNSTDTYTVNNLGELTIIGEGTINGNSSKATLRNTGNVVINGNCLVKSKNTYTISNYSNIIINNGTVVSEVNRGIQNNSTGNVEINGGLVQGSNYGIYTEGNVTITGGNIKGQYAIYCEDNSNVKVSGGEISSDEFVSILGNFEITGGKIYGKNYAVLMQSEGNGILTIGTNEENLSVDITNPVIIGDRAGIGYTDGHEIKFYDGVIMGPTDRTIIGEVTDTPTGYRVVNGTQTIDGTIYETAYLDNTYHITFNENYENAPTTTKDIKYNAAIGELPTPTRENYIFDGWYTAQTDGEKITKETVITADTTFYAHWLEVVASTTIGDIITNYASVQQAINAAGTNAGATVTLLKDEIAESVTVAAGQDIVIDLNGKTWANKGSQTITNNGKLILKGDGKVTSSSTYTVYNNGTFEKYGNGIIEYTGTVNYALRNAGTANLYEGTITSSRIGIENKESGKVLVDGIKIEVSTVGIRNLSNFNTVSESAVYIAAGEINSEENNAIHNLSSGLIHIAGGKINSNNAPAIANISEGTIYISNGEIISNNNYAISNSKGVINLIGGTIKATKTYAIVLTDAEGTLTIGIDEENPEVSITSPKIISGSSGVYNQANATFNFYDGIIMGPTERTIIGEVTDIPDGYTIVKGSETIDGTTYKTSILKQQYTITYNSNGEETPPATQYKIHDENITLSSEILYRDYYVFKGWATAQNATTPEYLPGATYTANASATLYAVWVDAIASTKVGEKVTFYDTVQGAIDAAGTNAGATVTLLKDEIAESITVAADQDILLNLNGKKLANSGAQTITNNGTLTLNGEGTVTSSNQYTIKNYGTFEKYGNSTIEYTGTVYYALRNAGTANLYEGTIISNIIGVENKEGGKVLVDGITIQSNKEALRNNIANTASETLSNPSVIIKSGLIESTSTYAIYSSENRVMDIQGGTIKGITGIQVVYNGIINVSNTTIEGSDIGISNYNNGQIFVNEGSTIIGNKLYGITNGRDGTVTVTGGTITGDTYGIIGQGTEELVGTINIIGGKISGKTAGVRQAKEDILVIGTDDGVVDIEKPIIISGTQGVSNINEGTFEFYDGIINGPDGYSISGAVTKIPEGYYIENGSQTIDGTTYETSYLAARNYEITQGATLADVVQVGDYVNYDANSNGVKTFTSSDCLAGTSISDTISTANNFYSSAPAKCPAQWRVLSVDKETGLVELMAVDPTTQTVTLTGGDGFVNAETVLNNIGAIYGSGKGATGGRSIAVEDIEQYSSFDKTKYENEYSIYGGTKDCTIGYYYKEIKDEKGNVIGYETTTTQATSSNPVTITQTHYTYTASSYFSNSTIHNMIFKNATSITSNKFQYWLASRCVNFIPDYCRFDIRRIESGMIRGYAVFNSFESGNQAGTLAQAILPVVSLQTNIKTTGKDANGAWQLSFEETTPEVNYSATLQSAIEKASAGSTIKVLNGIEETTVPTVPAEKGLVLDLNGKITTLNGVSLTNNGVLTITGEGKLTSANADTIVNSGRLKKSGNGTIENTGATNVVINNAGMVNVLEGTVTGGSKAINTTSGIVTLGANDGIVSTNNPIINGADTGISVGGGKFNFYDGAVKGASGKSIVGEVSDVATNHIIVKMAEDGVETSILKQQYIIRYNSNGGETAPATQYKIHDENITLSSEILYRDYYVFKGWSTAQDAKTPEYLPGATYTANTSAKLYAVWVDAAASTKVGESVMYYETVQGAIDAGGTNAGATVTLLKDEIAEGVTVAKGQNIILDLNGKILRNLATSGYTVNNMGELTIIGEGTIKGNTSNAVIKSNTTGKTVIDGNCVIIAENHYPISNNNIFIVNNGTIVSEVKQAIWNYATGTVEINGGTVQGVNYGITNYGNLNLYQGKIVSSGIGVDNIDGGKVLIDGITIQSAKEGIRNLATTNSETLSNPSLIMKSGLVESTNSSGITSGSDRVSDIQGGTIRGTTGIIASGTNGIVNVSNVMVEGTQYGINNYSSSQVFVNEGSTIIGKSISGIEIVRDGITTVTGGTITGGTNGIHMQGTEQLSSTTIITGGTITGNNYGIIQSGEDILIIGTDDGVVDTEKPVIISENIGVNTSRNY